MTEKRKILDIDGVSDYTTLSKSTIYKKVCLKEIPYHKIGNRNLFVVDEIDNWILNNGRLNNDLPEINFF